MKELVLATVFMCVSGVCDTREMKVEPHLCSVGSSKAQVSVMGQWIEGKIGIKCNGRH
jgi:hypothetical protein